MLKYSTNSCTINIYLQDLILSLIPKTYLPDKTQRSACGKNKPKNMNSWSSSVIQHLIKTPEKQHQDSKELKLILGCFENDSRWNHFRLMLYLSI